MTSAGPKTRSDRPDEDEEPKRKPANSAPDAVKDPNEKTDGKPGLPTGADQGDNADPGGG
ncbi:hypothetical protein [Methylobacterium haplocladii]|uniref:Uncharacterized protein n=1 Tax=Methylobacterium haplocladii TaxID=1176176 RepID=A0A512IQ68_9HYPH|nr:hypothetical protein [Methylobacterium haplocladii]GEO99864.1 hypothetical protein MHA02_22520 [Methylobacterium haplocladii]GJD82776.1 hypothetical protein HPGCJGGD_0636 [Methylobacterium haplocladii]GLS58028.1 hypothetical protein GCM10007887_06840 [Methylobacterium haplocladii]